MSAASPPARESARSGAGGRPKRRPERVGGVLEALLDRMGIRERVERGVTAARWEAAVGPHIARVTRPGGVTRGGTLFVEVAGAAWMMELSMMRKKLLGRLNEGRDRGRIEEIKFVQSGDSARVGPRSGRSARGRG